MTTILQPPALLCRKLPAFDPSDWSSVAAAFAAGAVCEMQQAWLPAPQAEFRPAGVRIGHDADALWVYAHLRDDDPFNPENVFNAPAYTRGDVFEMFLRPVAQSAYFELHVTPENNVFQLRIPSAEVFATLKLNPALSSTWLLPAPIFDHWTRVDRAACWWEALARVPFAAIAESGGAPAGTSWLFSFSRYDYTRGVKTPVLGSTSPHSVCKFHRQEEWGSLTME